MEEQWYNSLPRPIAFVFSGGASLGALQVGMLRALHAAGITPDLVVGTSIGALNGAVIADCGLDAGLERLIALWSQIRPADILTGELHAQLRCLLATRRSVFRPDALVALLDATLGARSFAELQLPFGVVATDVLRRSALFTTGELQVAGDALIDRAAACAAHFLATAALPAPGAMAGALHFCTPQHVPLASGRAALDYTTRRLAAA